MDYLLLIISLLIGLIGGFYISSNNQSINYNTKDNQTKDNSHSSKDKYKDTKKGFKIDTKDDEHHNNETLATISSTDDKSKISTLQATSNTLSLGQNLSKLTTPKPTTSWSSNNFNSASSPILQSLNSPSAYYQNEPPIDIENLLLDTNSTINVPPPDLSPSLKHIPHNKSVKDFALTIRKRLVIVTLNLPISAVKIDGKWKIEWDQLRSDHMTPNLKMMRETMDVTWVGWPGIFVPKNEEDEFCELLEQFNCRPVFLSNELKNLFFNKCCKELLWPLLHYRMPTSNIQFAKDWDSNWQGYTTANMLFSKQIGSILENDHEYIWIHNYHLCLVPSFLRKKFPRAKIGFFLHTPFPTSDVFRCLPGRANILRAILCADLVGFHTYDYARHFLSSVKRVLDLEVETLPGGSLGVICNGRAVCIRISHVGIHSQIYTQAATLDYVENKIKEIREKYQGRCIIVGFDEYDLVKGTLLKFLAYEEFLASHPEYRKTVVLLEIINGSYNAAIEKLELREQVMEQVANIKKKFGDDVIQLIEPEEGKISLDLNDLVAYFRSSTVGLFTSFWDGLNIIPFEFTASQDDKSPGALIVSEFMGCSRSLSGVFRVNPWKLAEVSEAIVTALTMTEEERRDNHRRRYNYVKNHTLESWAYGFLSDLEKSSQYCDDLNLVQVGWGSNVSLIGLRKNFHHLSPDDINIQFRQAHGRILIFDYDGTLTSETDRYLCRPSETLLNHLQKLCNDPRNLVFILSGRERKVLVDWFSTVENLGLAPEKGCYIRWPGTHQWQITHNVNASDWKHIALNLIQQYTDRTDGSYIEDKESAIVWHFEGADPEYGRMQASELAKFLQNILSHHQVDVVKYDYNRILEVKPKGINKGVTTKAILHRLAKQARKEIDSGVVKAPFFVLCVGDDRSDEDMFLALSPSGDTLDELAVPTPSKSDDKLEIPNNKGPTKLMPVVYTVCVGLKPSNASHYLHDPQEVLAIIESLAYSPSFTPSFFPPSGFERTLHRPSHDASGVVNETMVRTGKGGISNLAALVNFGTNSKKF